MIDKNKRVIKYMRLSLTDMCNFRCKYCMPKEQITSSHILGLDDIELICQNLNKLGITKVKLTGGEPLVRSDIGDIIRILKSKCQIDEVTLTTNGALLHKHLEDLVKHQLDGLTISIDTLDEAKFNDLVRRDMFKQTMTNLDLAINSELKNIKLNTVPIREFGETNILELVEYANRKNVPIRFIEMMPIGLGRNYPAYMATEILAILKAKYGDYQEVETKHGNGPARYYQFANLKIHIGIISAISNKFCESCNRIRVTSKGHLKQCLHYNYNLDLVTTLKQQGGLDKIRDFIMDKPKEHAFIDHTADQNKLETLKMSDIGG